MINPNKSFLNQLNFTQQSLIKQSFYLLKQAQENQDQLFDYSYIVMPAAKAYEGFLKDWLFKVKLINQQDLNSDKFRIGKALNPHLEHIPYLKKECLYKEITEKTNKETAKTLWQTWKKCRNRIFHYFHKKQQTFSLQEAEARLNQIIKAINLALENKDN